MTRLSKFIIIIGYFIWSTALASDSLAVSHLKELVRFQTVTHNNDEIMRSYQWILEQVADLPVYTTIETYEGFPSLLITTQETKTPYVWLVTHMDVVAAPDEMFETRRELNKLIGRGVLDMKVGIASGLAMLQELGDDLVNYNFGLMITADEEIGGDHGVRALMNDGYHSEIALIADGGFNWEIEEQAKGGFVYEVFAEGVAAHGSRPWLGENAIWRLVRFLEDVEALFIELKEDDDYFATVNLGTIEGGFSTGQVPDAAMAKLGIRYPFATPAELIDERMNELADSHEGISLAKGIVRPAVFNDSNHPDIQTFKQIAKEMYGINVGAMQAHGGTDAKYFFEAGIPYLVILPTGGDIHSEEEWIAYDDIERFHRVSKAWIMEISHHG